MRLSVQVEYLYAYRNKIDCIKRKNPKALNQRQSPMYKSRDFKGG